MLINDKFTGDFFVICRTIMEKGVFCCIEVVENRYAALLEGRFPSDDIETLELNFNSKMH